MKVIYPKNNKNKTVKVPNWLFLNRFVFFVLKLFLISKSKLFFKIKYKQLKPLIKKVKEYKNFEIVTVQNRNDEIVRILI